MAEIFKTVGLQELPLEKTGKLQKANDVWFR